VAHEVNVITADPLRLRQIILNLLSNAVKFTGQGGSVVLRVRSKDKHSIRISVRDTGRGIAAEHIPHLFQPYYQAAITDQGIGTGLGLAIIKHLTELHGGNITVESVVGAGTVFTIDLPLISAVTDLPPAPAATREHSREAKELLPI
jgi:signal transduction histidine kinase